MNKNKIEVGDIYQDCSYRPIICTLVDEEDDSIEGTSMLDGMKGCGCGLSHCGPHKITVEKAHRLIEVFKKDGEKGLLREEGWTEEGIKDFFKKWRQPPRKIKSKKVYQAHPGH